MRKSLFTIEVSHPDDVMPDEVADALNRMFDDGLADAQDVASDEELNNPDAQLAIKLNIGQPSLVRTL